MFKYPRTHHIQGSNFQPGDEDLKNVPLSTLRNNHLVIEEKMDGANCGISFVNGELMLQSRGHYLTGGYRERHFSMFKSWANTYKHELHEILEDDKYIMFGEWLYAKHTIYYDSLPSYFMEFDIYDTDSNKYLSTQLRHRKLENYKFIHSVPVIMDGYVRNIEFLYNLIQQSKYIQTNNRFELLQKYCEENKLDYNTVMNETDLSNLMEGLYIKVEDTDFVDDRFKFVRKSFLTNVISSNTHWIDRPIIQNKLLNVM